jgi:hypothetical protein
MIAECPMTEDCPGYDREHRVCLLRPTDCEFAPEADAVPVSDAAQVAEEPDGSDAQA